MLASGNSNNESNSGLGYVNANTNSWSNTNSNNAARKDFKNPFGLASSPGYIPKHVILTHEFSNIAERLVK